MIKGVHADGAVATGNGIGVPTLPNSGSTLVDAVEPRGVVALEQQGISIVDVAVFCKCLVQDSCAEEAGIEFKGIVLDGTMQIVTGTRDGGCVGQKVITERHEITALSSLGRNFRVVQVTRLPFCLNILEELFILLGLLAVDVAFCFRKGAAGASHQVGIVSIIAYTTISAVGRNICHPVTICGIATIVLVAVTGLSSKERHVAFVGLEVLAEDFLVACHEIHFPRQDNTCIGPCRSAITHAPVIGGYHAISTVVALCITHVAHPFLVEVAGIAIVEASHRIDLCVGRPAHAFVALRTVGWYADEIRALSPHDVAVELIDVLVAGAEG